MKEQKMTNKDFIQGFVLLIGLAILINSIIYMGFALYEAKFNISLWETDHRKSYAIGSTIIFLAAIVLWILAAANSDTEKDS